MGACRHILMLQRAHLAIGGHILMRFRASSLFFCCSGHILAAQRAHSAAGGHKSVGYCSPQRDAGSSGARQDPPVCPLCGRRAHSCLILLPTKYFRCPRAHFDASVCPLGGRRAHLNIVPCPIGCCRSHRDTKITFNVPNEQLSGILVLPSVPR